MVAQAWQPGILKAPHGGSIHEVQSRKPNYRVLRSCYLPC
jgi:hypothetical protein